MPHFLISWKLKDPAQQVTLNKPGVQWFHFNDQVEEKAATAGDFARYIGVRKGKATIYATI